MSSAEPTEAEEDTSILTLQSNEKSGRNRNLGATENPAKRRPRLVHGDRSTRISFRGAQKTGFYNPLISGAPIERLCSPPWYVLPHPKILAKIAFDDDSRLEWHGWHSFRRGLASNLYALGVTPKVIQAVLRHSGIGTTLQYYVHTPDSDSREAVRQGLRNFRTV